MPIVYILGVPHSGTTLLDILLSSHPEGFGIGEASKLSSATSLLRPKKKQKKFPLDRLCACLKPVRHCPFWNRVEEKLREAHGLGLRDLDLQHEDDGIFQRHNRAFFDAVQTQSEASFVVDSSKNLRRLLRLQGAGFELQIIHLIRDPRGVGYSAMKKRQSLVWANLIHGAKTALNHRMLGDVDHYEVRYEALANDPWTTLGGLMTWLGYSFAPEQKDWGHIELHHFAGNAMRRRRSGVIRIDDSWKQHFSYWQQLFTQITAKTSYFICSLIARCWPTMKS